MMHKRKSERGQSLVIIAVVMVGLIALMGLAIDGGNVFMQRRRAQNAADAAALAGTRLLAKAINTCNADPVGTDAVLAREVNRYAERNGISDTNGVPGDETNAHVQATYVDRDGNALGTVGGGRVPEGATGIDVVVDDEHETYFLTVIGVDKAGSSANGRAMSGAITQFPGGGGILPLAVHLDVVQSLEQDEVWRVLDVTNEHTGGEFCVDGDDNGQFDDPADFCVGDTAAHNAHRGWLNLNYIYNVAHLAADDPLNRTFEQSPLRRGRRHLDRRRAAGLGHARRVSVSLPDRGGRCGHGRRGLYPRQPGRAPVHDRGDPGDVRGHGPGDRGHVCRCRRVRAGL